MQNKPLIILSGPTAAGKSALSIKLAKAIGGEIISADSMQVYKHMDIGTAKITEAEMQGIKHYLIDILEPNEEFSVNVFQDYAKRAISQIYEKGKIPIIVGGTGFYIQSVLYDIDFTKEDVNNGLRNELMDFASKNGAIALHDRLKEVDMEAADQIHANNIKKVVRALEFYYQTGKKISEHNEEEKQKESPYNYLYAVLTCDRDILYKRIEDRIDKMVSEGLVNEVKGLRDMGYNKSYVSMQGLGYKEIFDYLDGSCSLDEAIDILKKGTRHFAKRQITWFKREKDVTWINKGDYLSDDEILEYILNCLKKRGIING